MIDFLAGLVGFLDETDDHADTLAAEFPSNETARV
ncbi:hypothetical protein P3T29_006380 [Kitasatospora sp. MAP5-34]|nr:hypothetical protein [Kitasatospora sp. MAP5-34]